MTCMEASRLKGSCGLAEARAKLVEEGDVRMQLRQAGRWYGNEGDEGGSCSCGRTLEAVREVWVVVDEGKKRVTETSTTTRCQRREIITQ